MAWSDAARAAALAQRRAHKKANYASRKQQADWFRKARKNVRAYGNMVPSHMRYGFRLLKYVNPKTGAYNGLKYR
jgi:hypothetical protein